MEWTERWKVAVTDYGFPDLRPEHETLEPLGVRLTAAQCKTGQEVADLCAEADAVLTQWAPVTAEAIGRMVRCRVIVRYGIGVDNVDLTAARSRGIPVVNVPDYAIDEVADHALALMLASVRKIPQVVADVRRGQWAIAPRRPIQGLTGKRLGLAGFGNIARAVAKRAQAFEMETIAYDPFVDEAVFRANGVERVDAQRLLRESDVLSVHLPLNADTRHFLNAQAFRMMKPTAFLINTSRGGVVDTEALAEALSQDQLAGVALDVLEQEPVSPDSPLLQLESCLITSHCAWYSESSLIRLQQFAALEVKRVLEGGRPLHVVNGVSV